MKNESYIHSTFRFDTLAEAACFLSTFAEIEEEHARFVEARLKAHRVEVLLAAPIAQQSAARAIMERLREVHRASF